ncbi:NHLP leader peptide family natural product precursor [Cohnella sp. CBP 2801]|uniref:NHLP leader peptide family natural product n=2 Tax=Cohnella zeiphila TaxID=2761120 RepID=A0A7X0SNI0_9BACL|nr:NHLP leader peptide family natural product precursor [Cohnella zeiphila]
MEVVFDPKIGKVVFILSLESLKIRVIKKAWTDPEFKKSLLSDPKKALQESFGLAVPEGIELKVVEETPSLYYLTIPANPEDVTDSEDNLKEVW